MNMGGMQMTEAATYAPSRTDDPPGTTRTRSADRKPPGREGVLIHERQPCVAHLGQLAQPKSEQIPCFTQVLTTQRPSLLGRANFSLRQRITKFQKSFPGFRLMFHFAQGRKTFDGRLQGWHARAV